MRSLMFVVTAIFVGISLPAHAQKVVQGADSTSFKKKTTLDFSDVTLEGDLAKPEGQYGLSRTKTKFGSLIRVRTQFSQELQKSADQL